MKLLSIGQGIAAAAILCVAAAGFTSAPSEAAGTCIVTLVTYHKDRCPPGVAYAASAHSPGGAAEEPTITPTADSAPCIKTLVKYHMRQCPI